MRGTSRPRRLKPGGRKACRCKSCRGYQKMKKKRVECEQHPLSLWDTLTPAERRKMKPQMVDARFFALPYVVVKGPREIPSVWPEEQEQKRLEEIALLARWRRKHQSIGS